MESPRTAERLMTPAAVLIAVGGFNEPTTRWVFVCLEVLVEALQPLASRFRAIAAADCNGRRREKISLLDQDALGKEDAPCVSGM
jgi:hypothetical protein